MGGGDPHDVRRVDPGRPKDGCAAHVVTRRAFLQTVGGIAIGGALAACGARAGADSVEPAPGRLVARPRTAHRGSSTLVAGLAPLALAAGRDGLLFVPDGYDTARPTPLVVALHGAGQSASRGIAPWTPVADEAGLIVLAPDSRGATWDFVNGPFGPDVAFIDRALRFAFDRLNVDPARLTLAGFSDGASYALSLGLANGDLFSHLVAFSPGIMAPPGYRGRPRVFVSHGTRDQILDIDRASRRIVPELRARGYDVEYHEFDGRHEVPPEIAKLAAAWLAR